jgi:hypothetical protein
MQLKNKTFLTQAQMLNLVDHGIAERIYCQKHPDIFFYSVAGIIWIWNGSKYRKTSQKYNTSNFL